MPNSVKLLLDKKEIKIVPDLVSSASAHSLNGDNEFQVTVINGSSEFASFQVELSAPGLDPNSGIEWYRVEPEVCTKKPPGDQTIFEVVITKPPIPAYDTTIELKLTVFSIEFPRLRALETLRLRIEKPRTPLKIYLPIKDFKVYPGDKVDIPVLAYNLSPKLEEITLNLNELDEDWFEQGTATGFSVEPGDNHEEHFFCQPPISSKTISKRYKFTVQATTEDNYNHPIQEGSIEILPQGEVQFSCEESEQIIPPKRGLFSQKKSIPRNSAIYDLKFENQSNLAQILHLEIPSKDQEKLGLNFSSEISIEPGDVLETELLAYKRRPWIGLTQNFNFEVSPLLSKASLKLVNDPIVCKPNTKLLTLEIKPRIPLWLQLGGGLLALLLLWLMWFLQPRAYHTNTVNSVRFDKNAGKVFSASSDQTIRRWQVDNTSGFWKPDVRRLSHEVKVEQEGQRAVQVIREQPGNAQENTIFAVGLENGDIELRDFSSNEPIKPPYLGNVNRVFDLDFTTDSNIPYLFSVHGSGTVYQWNVDSPNLKPTRELHPKFTIHALAISESETQPSLIIIAGRYNKLALWDWEYKRFYNIKYDYKKSFSSQEEESFEPIIGQNNYVESLAIAKEKQLLAMADNGGYITLWDMNKMRQCITQIPQRFNVQRDGSIDPPQEVNCSSAIIAQWQDGHNKQPVRSVALTSNGCYLASTGDDGKVVLWALDENKKPVENGKKELAFFPNYRLNSVDIKYDNSHLLVASDGSENRVRIYRSKPMEANKDCYKNSRY